jgi:ribonuclease BN (tRNA processing enzyme)
MKVTLLGTGGMFTQRLFHTNLLVRSQQSGNRHCLLVDCGTDIRFSLASIGLHMAAVDAVYITHTHPDHAGGLHYLAYHSLSRYQHAKRITLYATAPILRDIWDMMRPSCGIYNGQVRGLSDYFDIVTVPYPDGNAIWRDILLTPIAWEHMTTASDMPQDCKPVMLSYGLTLYERDTNIRIHYTGDVAPTQLTALRKFIAQDYIDLVLADCYTGPGYSGVPVHVTYEDYAQLPAAVKAKIRLTHYGDEVVNKYPETREGHPTICQAWAERAAKDGLLFANIHDTYDTSTMRQVLDAQVKKEQQDVRPTTGTGRDVGRDVTEARCTHCAAGHDTTAKRGRSVETI